MVYSNHSAARNASTCSPRRTGSRTGIGVETARDGPPSGWRPPAPAGRDRAGQQALQALKPQEQGGDPSVRSDDAQGAQSAGLGQAVVGGADGVESVHHPLLAGTRPRLSRSCGRAGPGDPDRHAQRIHAPRSRKATVAALEATGHLHLGGSRRPRRTARRRWTGRSRPGLRGQLSNARLMQRSATREPSSQRMLSSPTSSGPMPSSSSSARPMRSATEAAPNRPTRSRLASPSGNGIKGVVRIPEATKETHPQYFKAFQEELSSLIIGTNLVLMLIGYVMNLNDPDIYVNLEATIFEPQLIDKGYYNHEKNHRLYP